jgi:hypothetical protein
MSRKLANPHGVALAHIGVDRRHLAARLLRREHAAAGAALQGFDACTWSACRVTMISESVQPVSSNALTIGASSGASAAAQAPVAGSWISAPMLSDRHGVEVHPLQNYDTRSRELVRGKLGQHRLATLQGGLLAELGDHERHPLGHKVRHEGHVARPLRSEPVEPLKTRWVNDGNGGHVWIAERIKLN